MSLSCFVQDLEWRGIFRRSVPKISPLQSPYPPNNAKYGECKRSPYFCRVLRKVSKAAQSCTLRAFLPSVSAGGRA